MSTVIITLDDKNGRTLFGKRLSKDRLLIQDMITSCGCICASPYTAALFTDKDKIISPIPEDIPEDAFLFLETEEIPSSADTMIAYRWNRHYPSDSKYDPEGNGWKMVSSSEFPGYSHEKITKEVYKR